MNLFKHQQDGAELLVSKRSFLLAWEMGCGKTRTAIDAALRLYAQKKIDRVVVFCPAAVRYAWGEELGKLAVEGATVTLLSYVAKDQRFIVLTKAAPTITTVTEVDMKSKSITVEQRFAGMPIVIISYALLQQKRHADAIASFCQDGKAALICDESSFLKNRTASQSKGALEVAKACGYRWLLSGTPIANSPLDLFSQSEVMSPSRNDGPMKSFASYYHFRNTYGILGGFRNKQIIAFKNLDKLQKQFAPFVSRLEKKDCLDLPEKLYTVREVPLCTKTWSLYQELRHDALMTLSEDDVRVEPNAAVRLMRLCQLTSGFVGHLDNADGFLDEMPKNYDDLSTEKIDFLVDALLDGELSEERAVIVWCRWRRERAVLAAKLARTELLTYQVFGGQSANSREEALRCFQEVDLRRVLLAQPHAGGYGLNLTAAHSAVYLSNDFSYTTRAQSEDRCHRVGQRNAVTYIDVIATGPSGQRTIDSHVLKALKAKENLATWTCAAWRKALA